MALAVAWSASPSASRIWTATIIITGIDRGTEQNDLRVWLGRTSSSTPPTARDDFAGVSGLGGLALPMGGGIKTLTVPPDNFGRLVHRQTFYPGEPSGLAAGNYIWVAVTPSAELAEPFVALSSPKRAAL